MAWQYGGTAPAGAWLMVEVTGGFVLDFGGLTENELLARVNERAAGWRAYRVRWERGVIGGIGSQLIVLGRADSPVDTATVAIETENAFNSFWSAAFGAAVAAWSASNAAPGLPSPGGSDWATAIQLISLAAIVFAGVWVVREFRR